MSETRPGDVFVASSLDGPWTHLGKIQVADGPYKNLGAMSNVRPMVRPDGMFEIIARSGAIWISKDGILGPYVIQDTSIYPRIPTLRGINDLEDPMLWYSGGLYHIIVNSWGSRKTYHLTSPDGIGGWQDRGVAIDPRTDFIRYTDGTINHWANIERPSVYLENGHVVCGHARSHGFTQGPYQGQQRPTAARSSCCPLTERRSTGTTSRRIGPVVSASKRLVASPDAISAALSRLSP